jgi:hypothetical protein
MKTIATGGKKDQVARTRDDGRNCKKRDRLGACGDPEAPKSRGYEGVKGPRGGKACFFVPYFKNCKVKKQALPAWRVFLRTTEERDLFSCSRMFST